jgi:NAD(P)-dependent dehydrogenase (short-subunit alcohol dehydrogenase family)
VDTPLVAVDEEKGITQGGLNDEMREWMMERTPSKRFATAEDIAGVVVMLCTEQASYVNGSHVLIDGGMAQG